MNIILKKLAVGLVASLLLVLTLAALTLWQAPKLSPVRMILPAPAQALLAIENVTVLNPGEPVLPARTVLIRAGRIEAVLPAGQALPTGYRQIDGQGRWLLPGLIDAHAHVFDETDLSLLLAHGVTSARNMMGKPLHLRLREAVSRGELAGARLFTAGPTLNSEGAPLHLVIDNVADARAAVRASKQQGFDLVKVYDGLKPEVFAAIVDEAQQQQIAVAGHPPVAVPLTDAARALVSIEHVEELWQHSLKQADEAAINAFIEAMRQHQTTLVPSLQIVQQLVEVCGQGDAAVQTRDNPQLNPLVAYLGRQSVSVWADGSDGCDDWAASVARMGELTRRLADAGVRIGVGSDNGPHLSLAGAATLHELQQLQAIGLSAETVLRAATRTNAELLGKADQLGRIAPGFVADVLLLNADPCADLETLKTPIAIIADGRLYDAQAREQLLTASRDHAGWWLTSGRLLER